MTTAERIFVVFIFSLILAVGAGLMFSSIGTGGAAFVIAAAILTYETREGGEFA